MKALFRGIESRVPRETKQLLRRWWLTVVGTLVGGLLAVPLIIAAVAKPESKASGTVFRWERARQRRYFGLEFEVATAPRSFFLISALVTAAAFVAVSYMLIASVLMILGAIIQLFVGGFAIISFILWTTHQPALQVGLLYGLANTVGAVVLAEATRWLQRKIDEQFFDVQQPRTAEARISELLTTRAGVVLAIDEERRRIERDIHDGVQQNAVSLSMLIARARRAEEPERVAALLDDAFAQSRRLIDEMREVAWRTYPAALDEHGLKTALEPVIRNSPVPVEVLELSETRPPRPVEAAVYFVIREALTNVVKHAEASSATLSVTTVFDSKRRALAKVEVSDNGCGGASEEGGGLKGLSRRVAALDGTLTIRSPIGGGTRIEAEIPYA
ncbi:MAG TPA: hypothetical protein H9830_00195 [Candidatus Agrococcus pullicola]|uniref:histidine kinase n=1 Tax=Candidatus Agrococcus pullicola TaxID=2838429 RepID=A0A9D2C760_9MICO|nr:hypothetical protein [Candidatus Agrococcus pullicola]